MKLPVPRPVVTAALLAGAAAAVAGPAAAQDVYREDRLAVGADAQGQRCRAERSHDDPALATLFDRAFLILCGGATAGRPVGHLRSLLSGEASVASLEAGWRCGDPSRLTLPGIGPVRARRCFDSRIGAQTVVVDFRQGDRLVSGSALPGALGPLERGLALFAGEPASEAPPRIAFAALAPPPGAAESGAERASPEIALLLGIGLNRQGLHQEASRLLNDAISRVAPDADPALRAELLLEAALADSNIRFDDTSGQYFARAEALLPALGEEDQAYLVRKRDIYRAMALLNRRDFRAAAEALERLAGPAPDPSQPLEDLATLATLNQPADGRGAARLVALPSQREFDTLMLRAQAQWARSIALLALDDPDGAAGALAAADRNLAGLRGGPIDPVSVLWLDARLAAQSGRVEARRRAYDPALASYDRAVDLMTRSVVAGAGTGTEPAVAELMLERAALLARRGAPAPEVISAYEAAIDLLARSGIAGAAAPRGLDLYLDLLLRERSSENDERFFRAVQVVGEPAVARQVSQLRNVLTAQPGIGPLLGRRADTERELIALRYQIAGLPPERQSERAALEESRAAAEARLDAVNAELAADPRLSSVEDRPVALAELRAALAPGEVYLKTVEVGARAYGVAVGRDAAFLYPIEGGSASLASLAERVRRSIDGRIAELELDPYDVEGAHQLFAAVTGPAAAMVAEAESLVSDFAGALARLPASVLVLDEASPLAYARTRAADPYDFSRVRFLGGQARISASVSPRSFLTLRSLPASRAPQPFIAFAEPSPPPPDPVRSDRPIALAPDCTVTYGELANLWRGFAPIQAREAREAASALAAPQSPIVTGAAFTDTGLLGRADLDQYKVLHFATHGLSEGQFGCRKSPPALLTSLADADSNGLLSFAEVANLRLDANLVVLSACDTGSGVGGTLARLSGQEDSGSTLEGLVRAFLTANSRAVLATHWPISAEEGTYELMRIFYSRARTESVGAALRDAQRQLMARPGLSHPFWWAAFFIVGDASKPMLAETPRLASTAR